MVRGDSLDLPFVNAIRCHEFSQAVGSEEGDVQDGVTGLFKQTAPLVGTVSFRKSLDAGSPQLFRGCYQDEVFSTATFYFRRKSTYGIQGVTHPHTMISYRNCSISKWETDGHDEMVELSYEAMGMVSMLQAGDTPVPQGFSWNYFDVLNGYAGSDSKDWFVTKWMFGFTTLLFGAGVGGAMAAVKSGLVIPNHFEDD